MLTRCHVHQVFVRGLGNLEMCFNFIFRIKGLETVNANLSSSYLYE